MKIRAWVLVVALLIVAGVAFVGRDADPRLAAMKMCTPAPSLSDRGTMIASKVGSIVPAMNKPLPYDKMEQTIRGAWRQVGYWFGVLGAAMQGHPTSVPKSAPVDCGALLDPCLSTTPPPPGGGVQQPFNPKDLAIGANGGKVTGTGIHAVAQAASKYWTGTDLEIAVAIAGAESSYRPVTGPTVGRGTMRGFWQINDGAHPQLFRGGADWRDPAVNAAMAFDVYKRAGNSWSPWSTYTSGSYRDHMTEAAAAIGQGAGGFAAISNSPAKPPVQPTRPTPPKGSIPLDPLTGSVANPNPAPNPPAADPAQCDPGVIGDGGGPGTVGVWNIFYRNSATNITRGAGFADLVCLNELRSQKVHVPGYQVTPFSSAVEFIWKTSALDKVEVHRTTTLTGYARDKSAVWGIWRNRATGKQFAAICTHQLVQGGTGWAKQAGHVNQIRVALARRGIPVLVLGDMNRTSPGVGASFGGFHDCARIICAVSYGIKSDKTETLSNMGSDHPRVRFTFSAIAPPPVGKDSAPSTGTGAASIGGGAVPSRFDQQGNPRTVEQAIAWMHAAMPNGAGGERVSNRCERYMNLAYGLGSGYDSASAHWNAAGPKGQGVPPRGALVFWDTSNANGHVALSVGGGRVISTDFDGSNFVSGRIAEGPIEAIDRWGPRLGWRAPSFKVGSGQ